MTTETTIHLPLEYVTKTLKYLGLRHTERKLPDGKGVQLRIAEDTLTRVSVNVYRSTHSVLVQPHDSPEAEFVRKMFALRALELRRRGKIW